jgi:hypothetical protein
MKELKFVNGLDEMHIFKTPWNTLEIKIIDNERWLTFDIDNESKQKLIKFLEEN